MSLEPVILAAYAHSWTDSEIGPQDLVRQELNKSSPISDQIHGLAPPGSISGVFLFRQTCWFERKYHDVVYKISQGYQWKS
jgi:hypothetical protein